MKKTFIPTEDFQYPPSVQNDLIQYLKPKQQSRMRAILRVFKKGAQVELSVCLLDYLETGNPVPPENNPMLIAIFWHIVNNEIIRPLNIR